MNTKAIIEQLPPDDADTLVNHACVMYKEASAQGADPMLYAPHATYLPPPTCPQTPASHLPPRLTP